MPETTCHPDIDHVLFTAAELADLTARLAAEVDQRYGNEEVILLGVLTGAAVLTVDLARRCRCPVQLDFICVSSYGSQAVSSGQVTWQKQPSLDLTGRHVVIVEDIVDTGITLRRLQADLRQYEPTSLATLALFNKPSRREVEVTVDFLGTDLPDEFVVGYGLDFAQRYRHLPYLGVLKRELYL